jgi:hypothetical protein
VLLACESQEWADSIAVPIVYDPAMLQRSTGRGQDGKARSPELDSWLVSRGLPIPGDRAEETKDWGGYRSTKMSQVGIVGARNSTDRPTGHERAYRRLVLDAWDAKWHGLTVETRTAFLNSMKLAFLNPVRNVLQPTVVKDLLPATALEELLATRFVELSKSRPNGLALDRVAVAPNAVDFAIRVHAIKSLRLLSADPPGDLQNFVNFAYNVHELNRMLAKVLEHAEINDCPDIETTLSHYVPYHAWPGWVTSYLKHPLAARLTDVVRLADRPMRQTELFAGLRELDMSAARASYDDLVTYLALVEDLDPQTLDITVGLLPRVRQGLVRAVRAMTRPELVPCPNPAEATLECSPRVDDLRAFLLEVASEPPRVRQDKSLFQKEDERFLAALGSWPNLISIVLGTTDVGRLSHAVMLARSLRLVQESDEGSRVVLALSEAGKRWLALAIDAQCAEVFRIYRPRAARPRQSTPRDSMGFYEESHNGNPQYLGIDVRVYPIAPGKRRPAYWEHKLQEELDVRDAIDRAVSELPLNVFVRFESILARLTFEQHNPMRIGRGRNEVAIYLDGRPVPALDEPQEEAGRKVLDRFMGSRLIPLGCLRLARDQDGRLCLARTALLDGYLGRKMTLPAHATAAPESSRVVVQPDFSVMVIGLNPAPAAELAPFCERTTRGGAAGALVFKLTRESVVKAVANGFAPAEIVARLKRLASNEVPANVLRQVEAWADWVRSVSLETVVVVRCPDSDTADRVLAIIKRGAERVGDTRVALDARRLAPSERNKLRDHGILLSGNVERADKPTAKPKRRKRRQRDDF